MQINNITQTNPQFGGSGLYSKSLQRKTLVQMISNLTKNNENDILELTKNVNTKRLGFFYDIADFYNSFNFYRPNAQKEDMSVVYKIFEMVKKPSDAHRQIIENYKGSTENLKQIFEACKDKKYIKFANKVNNKVINNDTNTPQNLIILLLKSEHSKEYVNNFDKYFSYLKLNKNEPAAIENLDKMVSDGSFNHKKYDNILKQNKFKKEFSYADSPIFNAQFYAENYTKERGKLFETIRKSFYLTKDISTTKNDEQLEKIFSSTNQKNYSLRNDIFIAFPDYNTSETAFSIKHDKLVEFNKLFEIIDNNKDAKEFVEKLIHNDTKIQDISALNRILESIPAKKLNIFSDNANNIINQIRKTDTLIKTLKTELENPFFETESHRNIREYNEEYGFEKPNSSFVKLFRFVKNKVNQIRYNLVKDSQQIITNEQKASEPIVTIVEPAAKSNEVNLIKKTVTEEPKALQPSETIVETAVENTKPTEESITNNNVLTPVINQELNDKKAARALAKEELRNNIFNILNLKLGKSTFAKQREEYGKNATKMRLSLLPEIFNSISETRKMDKAVGKLKSNSANKDVLELYSLINGSNKKFINYLLKKRNVDDSRMFEVKTIIEMVKKAESKIALEKKTNPEYKARDARKYYNHLYESKIEQYGKVKPIKAKKIDAKR